MGSDRNQAGRGQVPPSRDERVFEDVGVVTVDGETFSVRRSDDGATHYDWVSGPNEGYGFTVSGQRSTDLDDEQHLAAIRGFLASIDPSTGYL